METFRDLADYAHLMSDLFSWPKSKAEWQQYKLTKEQVNHFYEFGYLPNIKLLDDWQVVQLNQELADIQDSRHPKHDLFYEFHSNESTNPSTVIFHSLGHWRLTPGFHDILWNPAFVMAASQLLGDASVRFWHDQLFCKPAKHGGVVAWHQDYSYWTRTSPMAHLTCWVGLDDASKENGCLYYVPKSHNWGLLEKPVLTGEMDELMNILTVEQKKEFKPVPIEMKKGYGTFHHPLLVHGSYENFSDRPRRAFVLNTFADGVKSNTDNEILTGVPVIGKDKKMEGKFFPVIFDVKKEL